MRQVDQEKFRRMEAALKNILDISSDEFCLSQARYGLNVEKQVDSVAIFAGKFGRKFS